MQLQFTQISLENFCTDSKNNENYQEIKNITVRLSTWGVLSDYFERNFLNKTSFLECEGQYYSHFPHADLWDLLGKISFLLGIGFQLIHLLLFIKPVLYLSLICDLWLLCRDRLAHWLWLGHHLPHLEVKFIMHYPYYRLFSLNRMCLVELIKTTWKYFNSQDWKRNNRISTNFGKF